MAAMESSSSSDLSPVDDDDDDAALIRWHRRPLFLFASFWSSKGECAGVSARRPPSFRRRREGGRDASVREQRRSRRRRESEHYYESYIVKIMEKHRKGRRRQIFYTKGGKNSSRCAHPPSIDSRRLDARAAVAVWRTRTTTTPYSTTILPQNIRILSECDDHQIISRCPPQWLPEDRAFQLSCVEVDEHVGSVRETRVVRTWRTSSFCFSI